MYQLGVHSLISYRLLFPGCSPLSSLANESSSDGIRPAVRIQPYKKSDVVLQTSCLGGLNLVQGYGVLPSWQVSPVPEGSQALLRRASCFLLWEGSLQA